MPNQNDLFDCGCLFDNDHRVLFISSSKKIKKERQCFKNKNNNNNKNKPFSCKSKSDNHRQRTTRSTVPLFNAVDARLRAVRTSSTHNNCDKGDGVGLMLTRRMTSNLASAGVRCKNNADTTLIRQIIYK